MSFSIPLHEQVKRALVNLSQQLPTMCLLVEFLLVSNRDSSVQTARRRVSPDVVVLSFSLNF